MAFPPAFSGKPPVGHSPAMTPSGNPGLAANAMAQVREAVSLLQMALPNVPMGSALHKSVLKCITDLSKNAPASEASPGIQNTAIQDLASQQKQMAPMVALMRSMQGQGSMGMGGQPMPQTEPQPGA